MAKAIKIRPPFAWLGRFWTPVGIASIVIVAAYFRISTLSSMPPGLDDTSARIGLQALAIGTSHLLPSLNDANGYAPLWVWLQAISVHLFGNTALALRLWPALLGTLAVVTTWFWLDGWFGRRVAWSAALLIAVSPWAVTLSRNGLESSLFPLLVPLTLLVCSRAVRRPGTWELIALGAALTADLLSGPIGWLLVLGVLIIGARTLAAHKKLLEFSRSRVAGAAVFAIGAASLAYLIGASLPAIKNMPKDLNIPTSLSVIGHNLVYVLLMFNGHGDDNYRHNLAGEPMLNAFVGTMMIAGLLVAISRLHKRAYRIVLTLALLMLIPAVLAPAGVPNSSWAVGTLPLIFALAGIGTGYMLELWYATFPINSAARATGQGAIILLLALSLLQGYTQYFRAYAGSTAVYLAYDEGTTQIASHITTDKFAGERYAVVPADQISVINYLDYKVSGYQAILPSALQDIPIATANRQFYIVAASRDEAVKILVAKFPGNVLHPKYSQFNQDEIYYTYEVTK